MTMLHAQGGPAEEKQDHSNHRQCRRRCKRRFRLLLEGLDEKPISATRAAIRRKLQRLQRLLHACLVCVSERCCYRFVYIKRALDLLSFVQLFLRLDRLLGN